MTETTTEPPDASGGPRQPLRQNGPKHYRDKTEEPSDDEGEEEKSQARAKVATVATLFLGSMAFGLASIPYLCVLTKPVCLAGLLTGVIGSLVPAWQRGDRLGLPLFVIALSLFDLFFMGSWPW